MKTYLIIIGQIIHNLQKERGNVILFKTDNNLEIKQALLECLVVTNKAYQQLINHISYPKEYNKLEKTQKKILKDAMFDLNKLTIKHNNVLEEKNILITKIINYYFNNLISPLIYLMINFSLSLKKYHPSAINAYCFLLQWKKRVGLERVIIVSGFIKQDFDNEGFLENMGFLLSEQKILKKYFLSLATKKQQKLIKSVYKIISEKINILHNLEKKIILELDAQTNIKDESKYYNNDIEIIYNMPIFLNMVKSEVDKIIKQGKIYKLDKNKNLFFEGDIPTYLHIILKGSIKIYTNNKNGKETILQLLTNRDSVLDSSTILDANFYASAQTIDKTLLFSIPVTTINNYMNNNINFNSNLLKKFSKEIKILNQDIKFIKSKSAEQKIGYFLLNLFNKQKTISNQIILPFNKSIIASYLGISRETLSRTINSFKNNNIKIMQNKIIVDNKYSLCEYCNITTFYNCPQHKKKQECEHKYSYAKYKN